MKNARISAAGTTTKTVLPSRGARWGLLAPFLLLLGCVAPAVEDHDDAANAATTGDAIGLTARGEIHLAPASVGKQVFRLAGAAMFPLWNTAECGDEPADHRVEAPGDIPDSCEFKIIPLATRLVTFAREGSEIAMREGDRELGRFAATFDKDGSASFTFNPSVAHIKIGNRTPVPEFPVKVTEAVTATHEAGGWISAQQDGKLELPKAVAPETDGPKKGRVKYGLQVHAPNPGFKAVYQPEGTPKHLYEINHPELPVARFDFSGTKVLRYSSVGAPAEVRATADEALGVALDYWNRVFRAASGETGRVFFERDTRGQAFAHDPGFNVVQWMTNERNGISNGVFQTDPNTGEIYFGNAYISAGFFPTARDVGGKLYKYAMSKPAPKAAVDQFVTDYIINTVAHEVGHTLGLNHNFRASNVAKARTPKELPGIVRAYFESAQTPDDVSTTTMEYLPLPLAGILGRRLRTAVLPHDVVVIAKMYFGRQVKLESLVGAELAKKVDAVSFCNDDDQPNGEGCAQFDHPLCPLTTVACFPGAE